MKQEKSDYGEFKIANEAIEVIVNLAIRSVKGVVGLHKNFPGNLISLSGAKNNTKGIKILVENNKLSVEAHLVVEFGYNIPEIALNVQQNIKKSIEDTTSLVVKNINIFVEHICFSKE